MRRRRFRHRQLGARAVDGDRGGEDEHLHAGVDRRVEQVDAADDVVRVVEPLDEVAQPFGGIGGEVIDVREADAREQSARPRRRRRRCRARMPPPAGTFSRKPPLRSSRTVHLVAAGDQSVGHVGADEPGPTGHQYSAHQAVFSFRLASYQT